MSYIYIPTPTHTHHPNLLLSPMVLYNALTVVYLYERSLHIVLFFLLFLFWFILCDFLLLLLLFLNQEGRSILSPVSAPPSSFP